MAIHTCQTRTRDTKTRGLLGLTGPPASERACLRKVKCVASEECQPKLTPGLLAHAHMYTEVVTAYRCLYIVDNAFVLYLVTDTSPSTQVPKPYPQRWSCARVIFIPMCDTCSIPTSELPEGSVHFSLCDCLPVRCFN